MRRMNLRFHKRGMPDMAKDNSTTTSQVQQRRPYDKFIDYLRERAGVEETTDDVRDQLTRDQIESIAAATSEDELFKAMETAGLTGLQYLPANQELIITDFRYVRGNLGIGVYAVINATDPGTGANLALDTGVERILAFLRMAEQLQLLPLHVVVTKKTTTSGNEMVSLTRPARRPVQSTAQ